MSQGFTHALTIPVPLSQGGTGIVGTLPFFNKIVIQSVTASGAGTYTPTAGMAFVIVCAQAAGGGGGGCANSGAAGFAIGGGGYGGEYIEAVFTAASIGASKAYVVGAKGTGGAAGNNAGTAGANTTFNTTWIITTGGTGGSGGAATFANQIFFLQGNGINGGSVSNGSIIKQINGYGQGNAVAYTTQCFGSAGGNAGSGAQGGAARAAASIAGLNGTSGSGGSSGISYNGGGAFAGGDGGDGFITFIEYISA